LGETAGKRPLGRPLGRWEDNIKVVYKAIELGTRTRFIWLRTGASGGLLRTRYETSGSIKCSEFFDWLGNC
jgi:hypothetical protein